MELPFQEDGIGEYKKWTFQSVIENLKQITYNRVTANQVEFDQISELTEEQNKIMNLLGIKCSHT